MSLTNFRVDGCRQMEDLEKILNEILQKYTLSKEEDRNRAYEECVEFAENRLSDDLRCNSFLRMAALMLEKDPVEIDIIREMVDMPDDAILDVAYDERLGFVLTANSSGLEYLSQLLNLLAEAPHGEHVHLYNDEDPLSAISFNLVLYHEADEWFSKAESEAAEIGAFRRRAVHASEIFAVQVVGNTPHGMPITRDRIYRVVSVEACSPDFDDDVRDEKTWRKFFHGDSERYVNVLILDDDGEDLELVLNMDDPDVILFKKRDIEDLLK